MSTQALNLLVVAAFVLPLVIGTVRTTMRIIARRLAGARQPRLLPRDAIVIGGIALSFLMLIGASTLSALELIDGGDLAREPWWIVLRAIPAVTGAWTYVYFELFVIGSEAG